MPAIVVADGNCAVLRIISTMAEKKASVERVHLETLLECRQTYDKRSVLSGCIIGDDYDRRGQLKSPKGIRWAHWAHSGSIKSFYATECVENGVHRQAHGIGQWFPLV